MYSAMENSESGDETYLTGEQQFILNPDGDDGLEQGNNTDDSSHDQYKNVPLREQDRFLPIANIAKIMKKAIPENGKIAKDAREIIQECVSEFISFVTSEASDRCRFEKRKTINGEDILYAMTTLGFDNYVEPLKLYLQKYREMTLSTPRVEKQGSSGIVFTNACDERYENAQVQLITDSGQPSENVVYTAYPANISEFQL